MDTMPSAEERAEAGRRIKEAHERKFSSRRRAAGDLGVDESLLRQWERGFDLRSGVEIPVVVPAKRLAAMVIRGWVSQEDAEEIGRLLGLGDDVRREIAKAVNLTYRNAAAEVAARDMDTLVADLHRIDHEMSGLTLELVDAEAQERPDLIADLQRRLMALRDEQMHVVQLLDDAQRVALDNPPSVVPETVPPRPTVPSEKGPLTVEERDEVIAVLLSTGEKLADLADTGKAMLALAVKLQGRQP